ncbi:RusA family crossover junction endodeoxyribonuclease [Lysinibacillus fusiformis]|uniref:RusA family crossover junction endodeoxyribonuclease n=1 Tax=Lysinibacillus fusiformis TaxID=28031 RepID=UPI003556F02B
MWHVLFLLQLYPRTIQRSDLLYSVYIKDGLSKVIWRDFRQFTELVARKWYSDNPRAEVTN